MGGRFSVAGLDDLVARDNMWRESSKKEKILGVGAGDVGTGRVGPPTSAAEAGDAATIGGDDNLDRAVARRQKVAGNMKAMGML